MHSNISNVFSYWGSQSKWKSDVLAQWRLTAVGVDRSLMATKKEREKKRPNFTVFNITHCYGADIGLTATSKTTIFQSHFIKLLKFDRYLLYYLMFVILWKCAPVWGSKANPRFVCMHFHGGVSPGVAWIKRVHWCLGKLFFLFSFFFFVAAQTKERE